MSRYTWDLEKARVNLAKHGVSFDEAKTVPDGDYARWFPDPAHSRDEDRFWVIGPSSLGTLLLVVASEGGPGRGSSPHGAPRSANDVNTKLADRKDRSGADDERPDTSQLDWSKAQASPHPRQPGEKSEFFLDGAVGYQLRLIPSNKVLARFETTLEAWPVIIETVEGGRSPRTLALDVVMADGTVAMVSAGPRLEMWARYNNGEPNPYSDLWAPSPRRVAEGAA